MTDRMWSGLVSEVEYDSQQAMYQIYVEKINRKDSIENKETPITVH